MVYKEIEELKHGLQYQTMSDTVQLSKAMHFCVY